MARVGRRIRRELDHPPNVLHVTRTASLGTASDGHDITDLVPSIPADDRRSIVRDGIEFHPGDDVHDCDPYARAGPLDVRHPGRAPGPRGEGFGEVAIPPQIPRPVLGEKMKSGWKRSFMNGSDFSNASEDPSYELMKEV